MTAQTIYPLRGIFTDLLEDSGVKNFLIPAYQRGYKWSSSDENGQVQVLMRDLNSAFETKRKGYYLQFITLKEKEQEFEVIDGQQRLTTLTILFSVLLNFDEVASEQTNFVKHKLNYQVRENFIRKFIYEEIEHILNSDNWDSFLSCQAAFEGDVNNQDVYFIYHATKAIYNFLSNALPPEKRNEFFDYISEKVLLIVNPLESKMNSEKIFINVNKGIKLTDEDLVKGLLLTRIPLENQGSPHVLETEINEIRTNLGRQWDDLAKWASRDDIRAFFKLGDGPGRLDWIIHLAYPEAVGAGDNPAFTYFDKKHQQGELKATDVFQRLREIMFKLNDLYSEPEVCNLFGYVLHASENNTVFKIWGSLSDCKTKIEIKKELKHQCLALLPIKDDDSLEELSYERSSDKIFNLFLMLDVAKFLPVNIGRTSIPYNFRNIFLENWSIEHIFPQNPGDFKLTQLGPDDLQLLKELLPTKIEDLIVEDDQNQQSIVSLFERIRNSQQTCTVEQDELKNLNHLIKRNAKDLHRLGNLALLDQAINSGLSNHFFESKRKLIVEKVSEGKFVPFHTYDIFSKLIIDDKTSLHVWTKNDIVKHEEYINGQIASIIEYLKK
jgi:hypothetical protein